MFSGLSPHPPPPPPPRWWGIDQGGVKSIQNPPLGQRTWSITPTPGQGTSNIFAWLGPSDQSGVDAKVTVHNRQSRFDLCYCQFHGLEVQSSDTRLQYRLALVNVPHTHNQPHGQIPHHRVKWSDQIPGGLRKGRGTLGLASNRRIISCVTSYTVIQKCFNPSNI